jgi:hypothetical protein
MRFQILELAIELGEIARTDTYREYATIFLVAEPKLWQLGHSALDFL